MKSPMLWVCVAICLGPAVLADRLASTGSPAVPDNERQSVHV
jgi:hypothetical protein